MKVIKGDLLKLAYEGEFDAIVHQCNCFHNFGAGIALQILKQFPLAFEADKNLFAISAGDAGSKVEVELTKGNDALLQLAAAEQVKSVYSVEYLKKMARTASLADTVTVQFAKDYPLKLDFKALNKFQMTFILAPRIENK